MEREKRKYNVRLLLFSCFVLTMCMTCGRHPGFPVLRGDYLGQPPPGTKPKIFAPGVLCHGFHEHHLTISPDGAEMFYVSSSIDHAYYVILRIQRIDGLWLQPEIAPFSGTYMDMGPCYAPDGSRLYFNSKRPAPGGTDVGDDYDIWMVEKMDRGWSDPVPLNTSVNTEMNEIFPSIAANGTIYFQRYGQRGSESDFYYARLEGGVYQEPVKLEYGISTEHYESSPSVDPEERWILFQSTRPGGFDGVDFYISFRNDDGTWEFPVNLGSTVSSPGNVISPMISPDGQYFFFARNGPERPFSYGGHSFPGLLEAFRGPENGYGSIYWVDIRAIEPVCRYLSGQVNHPNVKHGRFARSILLNQERVIDE